MTRKELERLKHLDYLIRRKATGTPSQLSQKLGLSPSAWYRLRDILINDLEWPLAYDTSLSSYYYTDNVVFEIGIRRLDEKVL